MPTSKALTNESADFAAFDETERPDVILGCESWLHGNIASAEIFPSHFQVTRNDRNTNGGGVLVATKDTTPRLERPDLSSGNSEITWCQLFIDNTSIFFGSYYRPQTETTDFKNLSDSLQKIYQESKSPYIILGGDFNLSGMTWDTPLPSMIHCNVRSLILPINMAWNRWLHSPHVVMPTELRIFKGTSHDSVFPFSLFSTLADIFAV